MKFAASHAGMRNPVHDEDLACKCWQRHLETLASCIARHQNKVTEAGAAPHQALSDPMIGSVIAGAISPFDAHQACTKCQTRICTCQARERKAYLSSTFPEDGVHQAGDCACTKDQQLPEDGAAECQRQRSSSQKDRSSDAVLPHPYCPSLLPRPRYYCSARRDETCKVSCHVSAVAWVLQHSRMDCLMQQTKSSASFCCERLCCASSSIASIDKRYTRTVHDPTDCVTQTTAQEFPPAPSQVMMAQGNVDFVNAQRVACPCGNQPCHHHDKQSWAMQREHRNQPTREAMLCGAHGVRELRRHRAWQVGAEKPKLVIVLLRQPPTLVYNGLRTPRAYEVRHCNTGLHHGMWTTVRLTARPCCALHMQAKSALHC